MEHSNKRYFCGACKSKANGSKGFIFTINSEWNYKNMPCCPKCGDNAEVTLGMRQYRKWQDWETELIKGYLDGEIKVLEIQQKTNRDYEAVLSKINHTRKKAAAEKHEAMIALMEKRGIQ